MRAWHTQEWNGTAASRLKKNGLINSLWKRENGALRKMGKFSTLRLFIFVLEQAETATAPRRVWTCFWEIIFLGELRIENVIAPVTAGTFFYMPLKNHRHRGYQHAKVKKKCIFARLCSLPNKKCLYVQIKIIITKIDGELILSSFISLLSFLSICLVQERWNPAQSEYDWRLTFQAVTHTNTVHAQAWASYCSCTGQFLGRYILPFM